MGQRGIDDMRNDLDGAWVKEDTLPGAEIRLLTVGAMLSKWLLAGNTTAC